MAADSLIQVIIDLSVADGNQPSEAFARLEKSYIYAVTRRYNEGIDLLETHRDLILTHGSKRDQTLYFIRLGSLYNAIGESQRGMENLDIIINTPPEEINIDHYVAALSTKAGIHGSLNQYAQAIDLFQQAILLSEEHGTSRSNLAVAYNNLGLALYEANRWSESIEMYQKSYEISIELDYRVSISNVLNNIANSLNSLGDYQAAIDTLRSAIAFNSEFMSPASLLPNYYNLAENYIKIGSLDEAYYYYTLGYEESKRSGIAPGVMYHTSGLARVYTERGDHRKSIEMASVSLPMAKQMSNLEIETSLYSTLAKNHEALGNFRQALDYYKSYSTANDSLVASKSRREIQEVRSRYAFDILEREKALLEQDLQLSELQNRRQTNFLVFLGVLIAGFVVGQVMLSRKNRQIQQKNEALQKLNMDKDALTRAIVHDLRAPLTGILGVIEFLRENEAEHSEDTNNFLFHAERAGNKLKRMITGLLDASSIEQSSVTEDIQSHSLTEIVRETIEDFRTVADKKNIRIIAHLEEIEAPTFPSYFERILENLISNAIKFSGFDTTIEVFLTYTEDQRWKLSVKDQGPGFTLNDKDRAFKLFQKLSAKPTNEEDSTGLGLYTVSLLVSKLNAEVKIEETSPNGSTISVTQI